MMEGTTSIKFDYMDEIKQITKSSKHGSKLSSSIWLNFIPMANLTSTQLISLVEACFHQHHHYFINMIYYIFMVNIIYVTCFFNSINMVMFLPCHQHILFEICHMVPSFFYVINITHVLTFTKHLVSCDPLSYKNCGKGSAFFPNIFYFTKMVMLCPQKKKKHFLRPLLKSGNKAKFAIKTSLTSGNNHSTQCTLSHDGWELQNVICQKGLKYLKLLLLSRCHKLPKVRGYHRW